MPKKVIVLGGGVGGLSAAHELVERGFEVEVYELRKVAGGKARSIPIDDTATGGRSALHGEHGFRFFPGFYRHLPDTMSRIPFAGQKDGVLGNLVQAKEYMLATGSTTLSFATAMPGTVADWLQLLKRLFGLRQLGIPEHELLFFVSRLTAILTSCQERRLHELENVSWWEFIDADRKSDAYRSFLAIGLTRTLVALKAREASTRTVGNILIQLLLDLWSPENELDRVLAGPTSEMWIDPWLRHLQHKGTRLAFGYELIALQVGDGRMQGATLRAPDGSELTVQADYFVCALPVERFAQLLTPEIKRACPAFAGIGELRVAWMNGIQFFLRTDFALTEGHANLLNSPSALTAVSQNQFWRKHVNQYGDGTASGCFSVDISDWETPGIVYGKPLKDLREAEHVKDEVLAQLRSALGPAAAPLSDDNIARWFLDPGIEFPNASPTTNLEPLLINTTGSWDKRPEAGPFLENLFLASDYVRTHSDLACMESANEAARRAVNGIIAASGASARPCAIWPLSEPAILAPARALDLVAYKLGLPHPGFPSSRPHLSLRHAGCTRSVSDIVGMRP